MTPKLAIASLDRQLAAHGDPVILRRYTEPENAARPKIELPMQGFVRSGKPDNMVGDIDETYWTVSISPTDFTPMWPIKKGDKLVIAGAECNVELPQPIRIQGVLVRCNLVAAG